MSKAIWKLALVINGYQVAKIPKGSQLLTVQMQGGEMCIWFVVKDLGKYSGSEALHISVVGTGHEVEEIPGEYLGTIQAIGGEFIGHVFTKRTEA